MPRQKSKPQPRLTTRSSSNDIEQAMSESAAGAWEQLRAGLLEAVKNGDLAKQFDQEHAETVRRLLTDHQDVAYSLFRTGFFSALMMIQQTAALALAGIPHECEVPGHNHGPAASARIGRA